jgi:hypothetical protein
MIYQHGALLKPTNTDIAVYQNLMTEISNYTDNIYKKKAFLSQIFAFESFTGSSTLQGDSANCKFTTADIVLGPIRQEIFFKVVSYDSQNRFNLINPSYEDLLIYDVISAIIVRYIRKIHEASPALVQIQNISPIYFGSFPSYKKVTPIGNNRTIESWDYHELLYTNPNSPFSENNIRNNTTDTKCIILMNQSIKHLNFNRVFVNFNANRTDPVNISNVVLALFDCTELYRFIEYLGLYYGFIHNDLHSGNIIFNTDTNKMMMIDLGRVSFKRFIDNEEQIVNDHVRYEIVKLGYDTMYPTRDLSSYKKLYSDTALFSHRISYTVPNKPNLYFGFVFDVITLTLNIYVKLLFSFEILNPALTSLFKPLFQAIVSINYTSDSDLMRSEFTITTAPTLNDLFINYSNAKTFITTIVPTPRIIEPQDVDHVKALFNKIVDGLLLTGLFLHSRNFGFGSYPPIEISTLRRVRGQPFHWALQIMDMNCRLEDFYNYIALIYPTYHILLDHIDYMKTIFNQSGGRTISTKTKQLKKYTPETKSKSKSKSKSKFSNKEESLIDLLAIDSKDINMTNAQIKKNLDMMNEAYKDTYALKELQTYKIKK